MATKVVGLDIGTHGVRAAEVVLGRNGSVTLSRFGQVALPPGAVVAGEVAEPGAVAFALKRLWREAGFSSKKVILGAGNQRVVVRPAEMPEMDEDELRSAIEFQADELIPIPLTEAILDFQQLEKTTNDEGEPMVRVLVVAAQREMVRSLLEALDGAGLEPVMIDIVPFALLRSLADPDGSLHLADEDAVPGEDAAVAEAVVDIGAGTTSIVVHEFGVPKFIRILMLGSGDLNAALMADLELDNDEAEAIKRRVAAGLIDDDLAVRASGVIDERITPLVDEIRGSLDYHLAQEDSRPLRRVVLTGAGSRLPRITDRLAGMLEAPITRGNPLESVTVGDTGLSEDQLHRAADVLAVPLGLALAGRPAVGNVRRLTLLPGEIAERKRARRQVVLVAAAMVVFIALLGYLWVQRKDQVDDRVAGAETQEAVAANLKAELTTFGSIRTLQSEVDAKRSLVRTALADDVAWSKLIQEVATVMPDDTWLSALQGASPSSGNPGTVTVSGNGFDHTSAARWLIRLDPLPSVDTLWLQSSARVENELGTGLGESTFASNANLSVDATSDRELNYLSPAEADVEGAAEAPAATDPSTGIDGEEAQ